MTTTLIAIASGQTQANIIPILHLKPSNIVLITSEQMIDNTQILKRLILELTDCPEQNIHIITGLPNHNMESLRNFALEAFEAAKQAFPQSTAFVFNATGGTKLMSMAFTEMLNQEENTQVIYLDSYNRQIETLLPCEKITPISQVMNIQTWLKVQGKTLRSAINPTNHTQWEQRKELTKWIANNLNNHTKGLISVLNYMCNSAQEQIDNQQLPLQTFSPTQTIGPDWKKMLTQLSEHGLIEWQQSNPKEITFNKAAGLQYIHGGWLEEYVYWIAKEALPQAEVMAAVEITDDFKPSSNIRNEIDVLIKHQNRLLMIECKTSRGLSSDTPYKMQANQQQAGGLMCQSLLVSVQPIKYSKHTESGKEANANLKDRVKSFGIHTCEGDEIKALKTILQTLMPTQ